MVHDGMTVGIGGLNTAGHPMSVVRGLIRRGVKQLRVVGGTIAGFELDMLIGAGCVREVVSSAVSGESLAGTGPFFRRGLEEGSFRLWECDEGIAYAALRAASQSLPFIPWKPGIGTSLSELNPDLVEFDDPVTGQRLLAVPAIAPDVTFLHVETATEYGMARHTGAGFGDRQLYRASRCTVVTTEKIVPSEQFRENLAGISIPTADAVVYAPWGAHPFSSPGEYGVDATHLHEYLGAARAACKGDPGAWESYLDRYIYSVPDHIQYLEEVGLRRLLEIRQL